MKQMTAALIINDKKILLVHNTKKGLRIEPPGGKKESNETLEECNFREVYEELGLETFIIRLFGVYPTSSPEGDFEVYMYLLDVLKGEIELKEPEKISNYGWYSYEDLIEFKKKGFLVPNLVLALHSLKKFLV